MLLINAVNAAGRPVELFVKDGKIAAVGQDLSALAGEGETILDAGGLTVLPAFVDLHCHWRTPGFEYKEDIETGSRAAAAGGYTFVNLMPNTKPVCSTPETNTAVSWRPNRIIAPPMKKSTMSTIKMPRRTPTLMRSTRPAPRFCPA